MIWDNNFTNQKYSSILITKVCASLPPGLGDGSRGSFLGVKRPLNCHIIFLSSQE